MISQSAPGKLYIAGEYAVVEPGHRAVLVAVDRFITVRITPAEHAGRISSALYETRSLARRVVRCGSLTWTSPASWTTAAGANSAWGPRRR